MDSGQVLYFEFSCRHIYMHQQGLDVTGRVDQPSGSGPDRET